VPRAPARGTPFPGPKAPASGTQLRASRPALEAGRCRSHGPRPPRPVNPPRSRRPEPRRSAA